MQTWSCSKGAQGCFAYRFDVERASDERNVIGIPNAYRDGQISWFPH